MKYLLDTCVISELIKSEPDTNVVNWINSQNEEDIFLSVLTIVEIQKGISKLPDSKKSKACSTDLQQRFESKIIDINNEISLSWGKIQG